MPQVDGPARTPNFFSLTLKTGPNDSYCHILPL